MAKLYIRITKKILAISLLIALSGGHPEQSLAQSQYDSLRKPQTDLPKSFLIEMPSDGVTDASQILQSAINKLAGTGVAIHIPPGKYILDNITLKSSISIIGDNLRSTQIYAKRGSNNPVFKLSSGPVVNVQIKNLWIVGAGVQNAGQWAFYLQAQPGGGAGVGGLWYSSFENLLVEDFDGGAMWLRGGRDGYNLPNQFITMQNLKFVRTEGITSRALLMTGQVDQVKVIQSDFEGNKKGVGTNIEISREYKKGQFIGGASSLTAGREAGGAAGSAFGAVISFDTCTVQMSDFGAVVDGFKSVEFENCWFEQNFRSISFDAGSVNGVVRSSHFANAAGNPFGGGFGVRVGTASSASIYSNEFSGALDKMIIGDGHSGLFQWGNQSELYNSTSAGITQKAVIAGSKIPTKSYGQVVIKNAGDISYIISDAVAGQRITIISSDGGNNVLSNGNIRVGSKTTVHLARFDNIVLEFDDYFKKWNVISTTGIVQ